MIKAHLIRMLRIDNAFVCIKIQHNCRDDIRTNKLKDDDLILRYFLLEFLTDRFKMNCFLKISFFFVEFLIDFYQENV